MSFTIVISPQPIPRPDSCVLSPQAGKGRILLSLLLHGLTVTVLIGEQNPRDWLAEERGLYRFFSCPDARPQRQFVRCGGRQNPHVFDILPCRRFGFFSHAVCAASTAKKVFGSRSSVSTEFPKDCRITIASFRRSTRQL